MGRFLVLVQKDDTHVYGTFCRQKIDKEFYFIFISFSMYIA